MHVLGAFLRSVPPGAQPFMHLHRDQLLLALREILCHLGVPDAMAHGMHSFRRGHADDISVGGRCLAELMAAGDWNAAAYMNMQRVESHRLVEDLASASEDSDGTECDLPDGQRHLRTEP